ncbi:MAG: GNAT family N-acetyltransferase [bacterium]
MEVETERLLLRPWRETDAEACYRYARDPRVGPIAGWPPHTSAEESRRVIREVLMAPDCWAIVLKEKGEPIGCITLKFHSDLAEREDEAELGYWLGVPFWGRGLMPEAARALLRRAFLDLRLSRLWCGYYAGNERSRLVQEKLGFCFHHVTPHAAVPLLGETRVGYVNLLTREDWMEQGSAPVLTLRGENCANAITGCRRASRGILMAEGKLLFSFAKKSGEWMLPGGGEEAGETPEGCCAREVEEESGLLVRPLRRLLTLHEYYDTVLSRTAYFLCEAVGEGKRNLTPLEKELGMRPAWLPLREAIEMFSRQEAFTGADAERRNQHYRREYTALREIERQMEGAERL